MELVLGCGRTNIDSEIAMYIYSKKKFLPQMSSVMKENNNNHIPSGGV